MEEKGNQYTKSNMEGRVSSSETGAILVEEAVRLQGEDGTADRYLLKEWVTGTS